MFPNALEQVYAFCHELREAAFEPDTVAAHEALLEAVAVRMWQADPADFPVWLDHYQALHREMQAQIDADPAHRQHDFLLAITVADRPAHVRTCLASVLAQCEAYGYGGRDADGRFARVTVVLAEDSREPAHIDAHRQLAAEFSARGLNVVHCDLPEQAALLHALSVDQRERLKRLLTDQPPERFWRKGQAANRNLAYLKLLQLTRDPANTLYYLVDSDQAFEVNVATADGEIVAPAFSVFHAVDRLFREHDLRLLTGKLVGDPPVSPAVMAANFLDDVAGFLDRIATLDPAAACSFHDGQAALPGDAAYHDHAELFGLGVQTGDGAQADLARQPGFSAGAVKTAGIAKTAGETDRTNAAHAHVGAGTHPSTTAYRASTGHAHFDYRCPLTGDHDHTACLARFSARLPHFFFGEHATRRTFHRHTGPLHPEPARTVYPGNYICDHAGLKYLIPFGHLRLRMSGPTAGRLIQAEIGARFASANLPMLHRRTAGDTADESHPSEFRPGEFQPDEFRPSEFRPGVAIGDDAIDIGDEFERQFFGDLMLFSVVEWLKAHTLADFADHPALPGAVETVEADLRARYAAKRDTITTRREQLAEWLAHARQGGRSVAAVLDCTSLDSTALDNIERFLANVSANFGDTADVWKKLGDAEHCARRRAQIVDALRNYRAEREAWDALLDEEIPLWRACTGQGE